MGAGRIALQGRLAIHKVRAVDVAAGNYERKGATVDDAARRSTPGAPHTHVQRPCPAVTGARGLEADDERA